MAIAGSLIVTVSARTQDFEAGMRKTTATLKFTEQQAAQVANAFGKLGDSLTQMGSKASRTSGIMSDLKGNLLGLAAGVLSFQALRSAIEGSVQAALKLEALNTAFKVITGSAKGAADAMQFVRDTGERLGVQIDAISTGYKTLLASTQGTSMSLKEAQTLFLGVVEGSRALGLSAEDTAGALRPLTQIISQQAFQADELRNELGSRLPGVMQMLVTASNGAFKSVGELTKAMEDGKLKGQAALDLAANFGQVLRNKFAPAAMEAARGTQASFDRLQTAVNDLAVAFGRSLAPALAEAARALTAFIQLGRDGAGAFGGQFISVIREATSVVIGLSGAVVVLGKYLGALATLAVGDGRAFDEGWEDVKQTFSDIIALQQKVLSGGFGVQTGGTIATPDLNLKPFTPGGEDKKAKKTEAEKEAERIAERQKDLVTDIANAYDAANLALEYGVELERTRMEQKLREAKFSKADLDTLMATYDATQRLLEQRKQDVKLAEDRKQLSTELQESLDKQLYTERELLQRRLTALGFSKEEAALKLKMFDTETRLREEAEKRKDAEREALQATKEHLATLKRLQEDLQPRLRQTRNQELQGTISDIAGETSDPYPLAQADLQRQDTLRREWIDSIKEDLERLGEAVANTFVDMAVTGEFSFKRLAESFSRMALEMVADAIGLKEAISGGLKQLLGQPGSAGTPGSGLFGLLSPGPGASTPSPGGGLASGGPVMPGRWYTVGERGPETLIPGGPGQIIPAGAGGGTFTMNVYTTDADSFRRNDRQISVQATRMLAQARRNL